MRRFSRIFAWTTLFFCCGSRAARSLPKPPRFPRRSPGPSCCCPWRPSCRGAEGNCSRSGSPSCFPPPGMPLGARGLLIPQMAFFALAHVAYVCWFLPRARRRLRAVSLAVTVPLLVFLFAAIVPEAPFPARTHRRRRTTGWSSPQCFIARSSTTWACAAGFRCCGPAVRLFRRGDRLEPLHRTGSGPDLDRYDHLLPRAIPLFPLRLQNRGPELTLTAPVSPAAAGL